jgi:hypothetical protein
MPLTHFGSRALEFAAMRNADVMVVAAATRGRRRFQLRRVQSYVSGNISQLRLSPSLGSTSKRVRRDNIAARYDGTAELRQPCIIEPD